MSLEEQKQMLNLPGSVAKPQVLEEKKETIRSVIKVEWKNRVTNLESKKMTWNDLGIP